MKQTEDVAGINGMADGSRERSASDPRLARAMEEYQALLAAGAKPDRREFLARYPELAGALADCLDGLDFLHAAAPQLSTSGEEGTLAAGPDAGTALGDFRIIREVGKGGMGVVYEAEQISLCRRVALKVLPFAATMDPRHLQRFSNEVKAAACLHHTNIVPVFSVGCERGVHFYAMQFIDGQPLSEVIRQLRDREKKTATEVAPEQTAAYQPPPNDGIAASPTVRPTAEATPLTSQGWRGRDYYRKIAELGIQAAEALDHAHQLGIVHRDIKPGNLMLDGRGNLWVTDFGLAHIQHSEASLTMTGDIVGTLRYMSPEQALAKRVPIDHRTDIYSLGVTLYELLTLQPAFRGTDRQELLQQIAFEEPAAPRRLNRVIPAELEIILLKAMEKQPQDRYATAQELADDLERWLKHEPIRARRPSWLQVGRKWARRHQAVVWAASLLLSILMLVGVVNAFWWFQKQTAAETEARAALDEAVRWQREEKWSEALSAVRRGQGVLWGLRADAALQRQLDELGKDVEMAQRLEEARLQSTAVTDVQFDDEAGIAAYREAFAWYGLDVEQEDADSAAEFIRSRSISMQLVAALDEWAMFTRSRGTGWKHLLSVARTADTNEWRNRFRDAAERRDGKAMYDLLASADVEKLLPTTLSLLNFSSSQHENVIGEWLAPLLRQAQQRPADFWINHDLATLLVQAQPPQLEKAVRHYMIAVALRPNSPGAHVNLGNALRQTGQLDEAIFEYREAIRLKNDCAGAHCNLGSALRDKGQLDEAIAECREAIRLKNDCAEAHNNLGNALSDKGQLDEAIAECREAIRLKKDYANAHNSLGNALRGKGQLDESIAEHREAIRLNKDHAAAHYNLGNALRDKGQLDESIAEYREAIRLKKDFAEAHNNLGNPLRDKGRLDEAIAEYREAIRLKKDYAAPHYNLGNALRDKGQLDESIAEYREAIRLKKDYSEAHCNLGDVLLQKGQFRQAVEALRRGHELGSRKRGWLSPSAEWLRKAESLAALDARLPALLKGQEQPKDARERIALAQFCQMQNKQFNAAATRWYGEAFAKGPRLADDLNAQHRYNAACAAALAGCGQGKDADKLDAKEHARLRQQALDWLRADLKAYRQLMEKSAGEAGAMIAYQMQYWLQDNDFARVRGESALDKVPEAERAAWRKLWADVTEMLAKARGKSSAEKKPDTK